jgi:hypothetical protein
VDKEQLTAALSQLSENDHQQRMELGAQAMRAWLNPARTQPPDDRSPVNPKSKSPLAPTDESEHDDA